MRRKREKIPSRRERLMAITKSLEQYITLDIASLTDEEKQKFYDLEFNLIELFEEIDNWRGGIEDTNLRYTMKFDIIDECANNLELLLEEMEHFMNEFKKGINIKLIEWETFEVKAEEIVWPGLF
tara:strand:+ start:40 stop:414 length:375 start_codon:yes stop_codon:yes gene_type:complete